MLKSSSQTLLEPFGWHTTYQLQHVIGKGASGEVWKAIRSSDHKVVAIKLMLEHRIGDERLLARMEAEADALQRLKTAGQHPGIVPIIDFHLVDLRACLVMDYVPGLVLTDWCDTENPSPLQTTSLMAKVAAAAGWFHAQGIIHRDLKPANVIVKEGSHSPVIVDFSIAKQNHELVALTLTQEALGTIPYMAPEQLGCHGGTITAATDVYALGSVLYELLTGKHPHPGSLQEVFFRFSNEIAPIPPSQWNADIPRDLEKVILKCLEHRPQDRYPSGTELAADLQLIADGGTVTVNRITGLHRVVRHAKKRPFTSALIASLGLLFVGYVSAWHARTEEARLRGLESQLSTRLRATSWSAEDIRATEQCIEQLGTNAALWRDVMAQDMVTDIKNALASDTFWTSDQTWIKPAAMPWLQQQQHSDHASLQTALAKRRNHWREVSSVTASRAKTQNLLPPESTFLNADGRFTRLSHSHPDDWLFLKEDYLSPIEVRLQCLFTKGSPIRTAIKLDYDRLAVEVWLLARGQSCPSLTGDLDLSDHPAALVLITGAQVRQIVPIHEPIPLGTPLNLTVRFENATIHADLNGRWQLQQDELFHFASTRRHGQIALHWPSGMEMDGLTLLRRSGSSESLMEQADLHFRKKRYAEAMRLYTYLEAQPDTANQALYKLGECQTQLGDSRKAMAHWDEGSQGGDDLWRQLCALNLWLNTIRLDGPEIASSTMARLPLPRLLHPTFLTQLGPTIQRRIRHHYRPVGRGPAIYHLPPQLALDATSAWELSGASTMEIAAECALKLHAAGLDQATKLVLERALIAAPTLHDAKTIAALRSTALDQWQRFFPIDPYFDELTAKIPDWSQDATLGSFHQLQTARQLARDGNPAGAEQLLKSRTTSPPESLRYQQALALVQGCLAQLRGAPDQAKTLWAVAAQLPLDPNQGHTDLIMDAIILRSAAQNWDRESVIQLLGGFVAQHGLGIVGDDKCALFLDTFVRDDSLVQALNTVASSPQGQILIQTAALRSSPWRVWIRDWLHLITATFLEKTCRWPAPNTTPAAPHPAHSAATLLIQTLATATDLPSLQPLLQHWNQPHPTTDLPLSAPLKSLLQARWKHLQTLNPTHPTAQVRQAP
jgi:serine/threonine protein kinase